MLLSAEFPFENKSEILTGKFTFDVTKWKDISDLAIDFIQKMLTFDPKKRPSATEALSHQWI